ncbi:hypothetical protein FOZ62_010619 [Perkinsus olseni]|uniref:Uncharacterized protein n=1 Tax=Perkinsus olseni TaxID=32597 RepID=A0A7J6PYZ8_PEROL|nr:hypothetical protein FOZ62_010619 [Perkinsus olseni]
MDIIKRWSGAFGFQLDENLEYFEVQFDLPVFSPRAENRKVLKGGPPSDLSKIKKINILDRPASRILCDRLQQPEWWDVIIDLLEDADNKSPKMLSKSVRSRLAHKHGDLPPAYPREDFPPLDNVALILEDNAAACGYANHKHFTRHEEALTLFVGRTLGIQPVVITCPGPEVFEGTFSWPPGLYFDESAFSEELASLNTTVVELNYTPDNGEGMVAGEERLETMGEKGVETSARLKAVCAAVREMLQDKFTSFKSFCKFVDTYAPGNFRRRPGDAGAAILALLTALARAHPESNDPGPSSSLNPD